MLALFGRDRQNLCDISYNGMDMITTAPVTETMNNRFDKAPATNGASLKGR